MPRETCVYRDRRGRDRCTECGNNLDLCVCEDPDEITHNRITSDEGQFLTAVMREVQTSEPYTHAFERIVSEVGMVGMKLSNNESGEVLDEEIRRELVRLAAAVTLLAIRGTPEYPYPT
jgi:hypothetical protein